MYGGFYWAAKKSGCDDKVTVLPKWLLGEVPLYPSKRITELLNNYQAILSSDCLTWTFFLPIFHMKKRHWFSSEMTS